MFFIFSFLSKLEHTVFDQPARMRGTSTPQRMQTKTSGWSVALFAVFAENNLFIIRVHRRSSVDCRFLLKPFYNGS
jgi:hypothetical protein